MKSTYIKTIAVAFATLLVVSCSGDKKKGIDYNQFKTEVQLTPDQVKSFDEITAKYQQLQEQNFQAAKAQGGNMDRVALGIKGEELRTQQSLEMAKILDGPQMEQFNKFVDENARKRPRYDNALLEKIKAEAQLSEDEFKVVNAANDAFEKAFSDAHDVYHGNNDLAKEYWEKFDGQRKAAIQKALTPEHYTKFEEIVKDIQFKGRK
ncbi:MULTISPECIES: hypothetical protein [unclassified Chryseobacterium]|uniref:hypothetical protein n=1 Tax=unclassified Chryseobacterium TaxID=2593645 RepID=UPI00100B9175|nr:MULTISPECIES: hypothetical protein [unclassified Chryseobacterium]RXM51943.1 hypothetical protein BOQ64_08725 [Chryseobacterium sp. CH25]RXM63862.1 hypothetical protein BOQ60_13095 [Chryseobacterium sp. CH1]